MIIKFVKENPKIPFPQANDVYKLLKYINDALEKPQKRLFKYISSDYVKRQQSYYKSAAQFLGFMNGNEPTLLAQKIFLMESNILLSFTVQQILSHEIFYIYYQNSDQQSVIDHLISFFDINLTTAKRRFGTVKSWVDWCDLIIQENELEIIDGN